MELKYFCAASVPIEALPSKTMVYSVTFILLTSKASFGALSSLVVLSSVMVSSSLGAFTHALNKMSVARIRDIIIKNLFFIKILLVRGASRI